VSTRVAPIFPVSDLLAALAYYRKLGFDVRHWHSGAYGFVTFDGAEIHLGVEPDLDTRVDRRATAYLFVDDADALAATWLAAGGDVRLPQDTEWGKHEGVLIDPDGNVIRFGSPMTADPGQD
jgi:catechol 2,3-dioxygenase-like lactoylglutathione lyase family enzyme